MPAGTLSPALAALESELREFIAEEIARQLGNRQPIASEPVMDDIDFRIEELRELVKLQGNREKPDRISEHLRTLMDLTPETSLDEYFTVLSEFQPRSLREERSRHIDEQLQELRNIVQERGQIAPAQSNINYARSLLQRIINRNSKESYGSNQI